MMELLERFVVAMESIAKSLTALALPVQDAYEKPNASTGEAPKPARGRPRKEPTPPAPSPAPAAPTPTPVEKTAPPDAPAGNDDDWMNEEKPAAPVGVSRQDVKTQLLKLQEKVFKSGAKIREFIKANTSNACESIADIKESDFHKLHAAATSELTKAGV